MKVGLRNNRDFVGVEGDVGPLGGAAVFGLPAVIGVGGVSEISSLDMSA